jgi:hypothetical protein
MMLQGHVVNGIVVPDEPGKLPEGAIVQIQVVEAAANSTTGEIPTLYDRLAPLIGTVDDLPQDASINLRHYLYGHPKR